MNYSRIVSITIYEAELNKQMSCSSMIHTRTRKVAQSGLLKSEANILAIQNDKCRVNLTRKIYFRANLAQ